MMSMTSATDAFWKVAGRWLSVQPKPRIAVECTQQPYERAFVGVVERVDKPRIKFRDEATDGLIEMDLSGADIRVLPFDLAEAVSAFGLIFEERDKSGILGAAMCVLTELRSEGDLN